MRKTITVNDPLQYKGLVLPVELRTAGGTTDEVSVRRPDRLSRWGDLSLAPNRAGPESAGSDTIAVWTLRPELPGGEDGAPRWSSKTGETVRHFWILQQSPDQDRQQKDGAVLFFRRSETPDVPGRRVARRTPGSMSCGSAVALMVIGISRAFFLSHQRVWVRLNRGRTAAGGLLAGSASRNRLLREEIRENFRTQREGGGTNEQRHPVHL